MKIFGSKAATAAVCGALLISSAGAVPLAGIALGLTMFGGLMGVSCLSQINRAPVPEDKAQSNLIIMDNTLSSVNTISQAGTTQLTSPLKLELNSISVIAHNFFKQGHSEVTIAIGSEEIKTFKSFDDTKTFLSDKFNNLQCQNELAGRCDGDVPIERNYDFFEVVKNSIRGSGLLLDQFAYVCASNNYDNLQTSGELLGCVSGADVSAAIGQS